MTPITDLFLRSGINKRAAAKHIGKDLLVTLRKTLPESSALRLRSRSFEAIRGMVLTVLCKLPARPARAMFFLMTIGSKGTRTVLWHPGTWKALEPMYTFLRRREQASIFEKLWYWLFDNVRSIPVRLEIVKYRIKETVLSINGKARILSIGSGSSRPVLESLVEMNLHDDAEAMLIDMDGEAIQFSEQLSAQFGANHTSRHVGNFFRLGKEVEKELREFQPNVVELVGLLDYLDDKIARVLLRKVARVMDPNGVLITGNILPNRESDFVTKGIQWPMVYRTPEQLRSLLDQAGFECLTEEQALGIHTVVTARICTKPSKFLQN